MKLNEKNKDFFLLVYEVVKLIPYGKVSSYGAISNYLGAKNGSRMVGWAMNVAHDKPEIPAHRVVNRLGLLTGKMHFAAPDEMQKKLEAEGIQVFNDKVVAFNTLFWNPSVELAL